MQAIDSFLNIERLRIISLIDFIHWVYVLLKLIETAQEIAWNLETKNRFAWTHMKLETKDNARFRKWHCVWILSVEFHYQTVKM